MLGYDKSVLWAVIKIEFHVLELIVIALVVLLYLLVKIWRRI
jgi:hypothetical protein